MPISFVLRGIVYLSAGIYFVFDKQGRVNYIGSTRADVKTRLKGHISTSRSPIATSLLGDALDSVDRKNLRVAVLNVDTKKSTVDQVEMHLIHELCPQFNINGNPRPSGSSKEYFDHLDAIANEQRQENKERARRLNIIRPIQQAVKYSIDDITAKSRISACGLVQSLADRHFDNGDISIEEIIDLVGDSLAQKLVADLTRALSELQISKRVKNWDIHTAHIEKEQQNATGT